MEFPSPAHLWCDAYTGSESAALFSWKNKGPYFFPPISVTTADSKGQATEVETRRLQFLAEALGALSWFLQLDCVEQKARGSWGSS